MVSVKPPAEVLAKFLQAGEQLRQIAELRMVQSESQLAEASHHAIAPHADPGQGPGKHRPCRWRCRSPPPRRAAAKAGHGFQLVCRPVAEIERTRLEHFKRIAAVRNVFQVQLRRPANDGQADRHVAAADAGRRRAEFLEQPGVLQQMRP